MEPRVVTIQRQIDELQKELNKLKATSEPLTALKAAVQELAAQAKRNGINSARFTAGDYNIQVQLRTELPEFGCLQL